MKSYIKSESLRSLNTSNSTQKFLLNWINSYRLCKILTPAEVPEKFRTGIFPLELLRAIDPDINSFNAIPKPRSREDCLTNLNLFINYLQNHGLQLKDSLQTNLYLGKSQQVWEVLEYLFDIYLKTLKTKNQEEIFDWLNEKIEKEITFNTLSSTFKDAVHSRIYTSRILAGSRN